MVQPAGQQLESAGDGAAVHGGDRLQLNTKERFGYYRGREENNYRADEPRLRPGAGTSRHRSGGGDSLRVTVKLQSGEPLTEVFVRRGIKRKRLTPEQSGVSLFLSVLEAVFGTPLNPTRLNELVKSWFEKARRKSALFVSVSRQGDPLTDCRIFE